MNFVKSNNATRTTIGHRLPATKHSRLRAMTLCIAAHANQAGDPRIVLCFDSLIGAASATSETKFKCDQQFANGLVALIAGMDEDVTEALRVCKKRLKSIALTLDNFKSELWSGLRDFKIAVDAGEYRQGIGTDIQFIVAGFVEGAPQIVYMDPGQSWVHHSFQAIGSGAASADAMLKWRKSSPDSSLNAVMYFAYEAKKLGEVSPFVGQRTTIFVLGPDTENIFNLQVLRPPGIDYLESQFKRFGPQSFTPLDHFPMKELV